MDVEVGLVRNRLSAACRHLVKKATRYWGFACVAMAICGLWAPAASCAYEGGGDGPQVFRELGKGRLATLNALEARALERVASVSASTADARIAASELEARLALQGARIFADGGIAKAHEVVTDTVYRDYERLGVEAGVRWPLFGTRQSQFQSIEDGKLALELARHSISQARLDMLYGVRAAYLRHLYAVRRERVASAFLVPKPVVAALLKSRVDEGLMLAGERLDLMALYDVVQSTVGRQKAIQGESKRELSRLVAESIDRVDDSRPDWPRACLDKNTGLADPERHPMVAKSLAELDYARRKLEQRRYDGIEGGVSLAQGVTQDIGGQFGRSTIARIDVSAPYELGAYRDAVNARTQGEVFKAEENVRFLKGKFEGAVDSALDRWRLGEEDVAAYVSRLLAAKEISRVATDRLEAFDGDGYSKLVTSRYALYQAAMQVIEGEEKRDLEQLDVLALSGDCAAGESRSANRTGDWVGAVLPLLSDVPPGIMRTTLMREVGGRLKDRLSLYAWDGSRLIKNPLLLDEAPAGTKRLLLSLRAGDIYDLSNPQAAALLESLFLEAHKRNISVELLVGDPTLIRPKERSAILELLKPLSKFAFDGLNLDLERDQLPKDDRGHWDEWVLDSIRLFRKELPWRLSVTTHYRELRNHEFIHKLGKSGASEIVAMVYVANPARVVRLVNQLGDIPGGIRFSIAQSIEPDLDQESSSYTAGRAVALERWAWIAKALSDRKNFNGIVIQSFEDYLKAEK
ncbi:MAG: TolC family protein [Zoogloea sp.]|nr:TolC family protein [Zoogloea sp.]